MVNPLRFSFLLALVALSANLQFGYGQEKSTSPLSVYNDRIEAVHRGNQGVPLNNLAGDIAWVRSYIMDSYIDVYSLTGDPDYLDHFIEVGDRVMAARADAAGELDYRGRQTHGWMTAGHYTLGMPVVLEDAAGQPSLEVRTTENSYNNLTTIEILEGSVPGTFRIDVRSTRVNPPYERVYDNLTMQNVEAQVNAAPGVRSYLRVKRLGDSIPIPVEAFTPESSPVVLHGHHTGRIVTPLARFCDVVLSSSELTDYHDKAREYLDSLHFIMAEHDQSFRESYDGTRGWTIFEKGIPFWSDGVVEPHNTMAASGSAYLHLYRATGEPYFRERATQLARLIKDHHEPMPNETWMFYYWWGEIHDGWEIEDEVSTNTPRRNGVKSPEDFSHLQLTLNFIVDCHLEGIVFTRSDLERWANTAKRLLLVEDDEGIHFLAHVDGDSRGKARLWGNHVIYGLVSIARELEDQELYNACRTVLFENYQDTGSGAGILSWARLATAASVLEPDLETGADQLTVY